MLPGKSIGSPWYEPCQLINTVGGVNRVGVGEGVEEGRGACGRASQESQRNQHDIQKRGGGRESL